MTTRYAADAIADLTEKQREVLGRLARHQSIKTIADEMSVSDSRVNQHIRKLKDRLGVNNPEDLVALWMEANQPQPFRKTAYRKSQLPVQPELGDERATAGAATFRFRDGGELSLPAPWETLETTRVGPGLLDGPGASAKRMGFIILVAIGLPVAVIFTLSAMLALTEMLRALQ